MTAMVKAVAALDNFALELAYALLMPSGGVCRQIGIVEQTSHVRTSAPAQL